MKKRQIIITIAGVLILAGALFAAGRLSGSGGKASTSAGKGPQPAPTGGAEAVRVIEVQNGPLQTYVDLTGRLQPEDKIEIFSEVTGTFQNGAKPFKAGVRYRKGQVLLALNADEVRQNLTAQKSSFASTLAQVVPDLKIDFPAVYEAWRKYLLNLDYDARLRPLPPVQGERLKLFLTGRNVYAQYYNIKQLEERLDKYTIRAPFDGTVTEALVNEGTLVRVGQRLGEFTKTGVYEMEAAVGSDELPYVAVGEPVTLSPTTQPGEYRGVVARINEKLDTQTQTVQTYVRVSGEDLKTNMYLAGRIKARQFDSVIQVPRTVLLENESAVLVVQDSVAKLQPVEVLKDEGETVILRGLGNGALLINEDKTKAFAGKKVTVVKDDGRGTEADAGEMETADAERQ